MDSQTLAAIGIGAAFFALALASCEILVRHMGRRSRYRERLGGIAKSR